ncbi:MAG: transcriptional repressor LexA [Deferribacterota bacterium]|nr:transcriptional repressor LexA [Deferribacterota bacterium]
MTSKQKKYIEFINSFIEKNDYPPTIREIALGLGVSSTSSVKKMLDRLKAVGAIEKKTNKARGLEVKKKGIPLIGRIRAGVPTFSEENIEKFINIESLCRGSDVFFLKAEGDSMVERGIFEGDYLMVKKTMILNNNDIGIFRINGEVTVKTFSIKKNPKEIRLIPANAKYSIININKEDDFEIVGKVILILRDLGVSI